MLGTDLETSPEDSAFEQLSRAVRDGFRDLFGDRYTLSELSQQVLASAPNRVARVLSGSRTMTFDEGMRLLAHTGTDPALFLELVLARLPKPSPAATVRQLCLPPGAELDPFLIELKEILAAPGHPGPDRGSCIPALEQLEELRFASAPAALLQVESICRDLATEVAAGCSWKQRAQRELVQGLGLWATISRTLGEMASSAQGYEAAFELAAKAGDTTGEAILRKRSSYLLMDSGYSHFALIFLGQAVEVFSQAGADVQLAECLVDRGIIYMKTDRFDLALQDFLFALERLPSSSQTYRIAAQHWLSLRAEHLRDLPEARNRLDLAIAEFGSRSDSLLGQIYWSAGRLAYKGMAFPEARVYYGKALRVLSEMGEPFEGELVLLDIAEIALNEKSATEMDEVGRDFLSRLPKNRHSRKATEALIKIGNRLRWGKPTVGDLDEARKKLKEAGAELPPPSMKYA
jgi:tetratricopeptide (TPR) repeat protein